MQGRRIRRAEIALTARRRPQQIDELPIDLGSSQFDSNPLIAVAPQPLPHLVHGVAFA